MAEIGAISDIIEKVSPYYSNIKEKKKRDSVPAEEHTLVYDSSSETLEPVYFWILDFMNSMFGGKVEKLVDNFTSSPGSGYFSEIGARATRMQEEGMKVMQTVGVMIKSLVNIIYDLRQFEIRFHDYEDADSSDKSKAEAGLFALKQIWLDKVDIVRGNTSIKALAFSQAAFATLIDAFMVAKTEKDVEKMDLNDRVKRILVQRISEFNKWRELSEKELRKRYDIQRSWLKNQVNSLRLYTRWVKPYLIAAEKLTMKEPNREPEIVNIFNTVLLELTLIGKREINVKDEAVDKNLPEQFRNLKPKRKYYNCVLIDFVFRGIPQRVIQQAHFAFGGRAEVTFRGYCLNEDELALLDEKLKESDLNDALKLADIVTDESLNEIREDIEYFLKEEKERKLDRGVTGKESDDVNPFSALFGFGKEKPKEKDEKKEKITKLKDKGVAKDSYAEQLVRVLGEQKAASSCFAVFDVYKKSHGMASHPSPFE